MRPLHHPVVLPLHHDGVFHDDDDDDDAPLLQLGLHHDGVCHADDELPPAHELVGEVTGHEAVPPLHELAGHDAVPLHELPVQLEAGQPVQPLVPQEGALHTG